ncbi:F-box domain [Cordyceps militaris]|uniref:F-box domain n=1 Tax=Cordyceps militaris TaxID=73501 RepID=A0A2H4S6W1_CORMI|nr:F-box domain [Cordyceps militaris]
MDNAQPSPKAVDDGPTGPQRLLHLPMELLVKIANQTLPDIENFALTCSRLREAASPALEEHHQLRNRYRTCSSKSGKLGRVVPLLAKIVQTPLIAEYIVHLDLGDGHGHGHGEGDSDSDGDSNRGSDSDSDSVDSRPTKEYIQRITEVLRPLVGSSAHLSLLNDGDKKLHEHWLCCIAQCPRWDRKREIYPLSFLASLLINVETLILPELWSFGRAVDGNPVADLLHLLVKNANDESLKNQPLQKLRTVKKLRSSDDNLHSLTANIEYVFPFLALDSLQELNLSYGVCPSLDLAQNTFSLPLGRNLKVLKLQNLAVAHTSALYNAVVRHDTEIERVPRTKPDDRMRADVVLRTLIMGFSKTLEKLVLTGIGDGLGFEVLDCPLWEFSHLKHLELSTEFIDNLCELNVSVEDAPWHARTEERYGLKRNKKDFEDARQVTHNTKTWCLVDVLPESLETLTLRMPITRIDPASVCQFFYDFEKLRRQRLPNLHRIEVCIVREARGSEEADQRYFAVYKEYLGDIGVSACLKWRGDD